jgi:hypothetical protein
VFKQLLQSFIWGLLGLVAALLTSCASSEQAPVNQSIWTYQPDAITVSYSAPAKLNMQNDQPHVLLLAVVQTADLQSIQSYLQNSQGISLLLEKSNDPGQTQSFYITKIFVNPGDSHQVKVTRMAGMQHVVVVAGYNHLYTDQVVKIFNIPVDSKSAGLAFWHRIHYPAAIDISVALGEQGIDKAYYVKN